MDVSSMSSRQDLARFFGQVIGEGLRGEVEKFFLFNQGSYSDCALVVTTAGDVFAMEVEIGGGSGDSALLDHVTRLRPRKLPEICGLGIAGVAQYWRGYEREEHTMILTTSGQLFGWGNNDCGQLAVVPDVDFSPLPLTAMELVEAHKIVQVACGNRFTVCRTLVGQVFTWGSNESGVLGDCTNRCDDGETGDDSESDDEQPNRYRVGAGLEGKHVESIACGDGFVMALTAERELWSWGCNKNGQLGRQHISSCVDYDRIPGRVVFPDDAPVKSVACGSHHALAVTANGYLYAWGLDHHGQLGLDRVDPSDTAVWTPQRVNFTRALPSLGQLRMPKRARCPCMETYQAPACWCHFVEEIAAYPGSDVSAAKTRNGKVDVWGSCYGGRTRVTTPTVTDCSDLEMAFARTSSMSFSFISADPKPVKKWLSIHSCLKESFNDPSTADMRFTVEGKVIHVHKAVLKIRSEHFRRMFAVGASWAEANTDEVEIKNHSFPVYRAYLNFLYTEMLVENLSPEDLIGLLDLAQSYCDDELRSLCVEKIALTMTCDSVSTFFVGANHCAAKDVEEFSCTFMIQNLTELATSGALQLGLGEDLLLSLLRKAAEKRAFRF